VKGDLIGGKIRTWTEDKKDKNRSRRIRSWRYTTIKQILKAYTKVKLEIVEEILIVYRKV